MFSSTILSALFATIACAVASGASPSISLRVTGPDSVNNVEDLKVVATVTNAGDRTVKLLNDPLGPLSKMPADTFTIISDVNGTRPSFTGVKVKYVPGIAAERQAFTVLQPGQSIKVEHDLSSAYNFTTAGEGAYSFEARNLFYLVDDSAKVVPIRANAEAHRAHVFGKLTVSRPAQIQKRATFNGCSSSEQSSILSAASAAQTYAANALSYLESHSSEPTVRYSTWFGAFTASRFSTVQSHFSSINSKEFSTFTYDCTCRSEAGVLAFVDPEVFGVIHLCPTFWTVPVTGTDSQGGTLVHESSHFTANGGTDDHVYGQLGCQSLALSSPDAAIDNADSHEYFAENNPAQA